jgi:hypothetical protein
MVHFQTKNLNLGKFWRAFEWKRLVYSMAIRNILLSFGNLLSIWYIFPAFWYSVARKIRQHHRRAVLNRFLSLRTGKIGNLLSDDVTEKHLE